MYPVSIKKRVIEPIPSKSRREFVDDLLGLSTWSCEVDLTESLQRLRLILDFCDFSETEAPVAQLDRAADF